MYAPIIIPTLNRIKHLKRCIESLQKNKEACDTELYISVDYPPSKKYEDGYEDVKAYVKTITGFKQVHLYFQSKNLGPGLNSKFLRDEVEKKHESFIVSEDDNEFSEDFLTYMNWGLEKFKDDDNVYAICSTADFPIKTGNFNADYLMLEVYNAYGTGHWIEKYNKCLDYLQDKDVNDIYRSKYLKKKILFYSPMIYRWVAMDSLRKISVMRSKTGNLTNIDIWRNVYCIDKSLKCVIPIEQRSRNWGQDGTGIHAVPGQNSDYVPSITLKEGSEWVMNPICLPETETYNNILSHAEVFAITKRQLVGSMILLEMNAIFGNNTILLIYNKIRSFYRWLTHKKPCEIEEFKYI